MCSKDNLNTIEDDKMLDASNRLDFMSGIYFRVFENLHSEENDPARFKLDLMVNHGAILDAD